MPMTHKQRQTACDLTELPLKLRCRKPFFNGSKLAPCLPQKTVLISRSSYRMSGQIAAALVSCNSQAICQKMPKRDKQRQIYL